MTEKESIQRCGFCASTLYIDIKGTRLTYIVDALVAADGLQGLILKALSDREIPATAQVAHSKLIYFPYWEVKTGGKEPITKYFMAANPPIVSMGDISPASGQRHFFTKEKDVRGELVEPVYSSDDLPIRDEEGNLIAGTEVSLLFYPIH